MRALADRFIIERDTVAAWEGWLATWEWRVFATFTFAEDKLPDDLARSRWDAWRVAVDTYTFGVAGRMCGLGWTWALALEYQRRGSPHYHALGGASSRELADLLARVSRRTMRDLWADGRPVDYRTWMARANVEGQGWARVEAIKSRGAVSAYAAKYAVKAGTVEIVRPTRLDRLAGHPPENTTGTLRDLQALALLPTGADRAGSPASAADARAASAA